MDKRDYVNGGALRGDAQGAKAARVVRSFVNSGSGGAGVRKAASGAARMSVDELGREQQRRAVAYSRARGVL